MGGDDYGVDTLVVEDTAKILVFIRQVGKGLGLAVHTREIRVTDRHDPHPRPGIEFSYMTTTQHAAAKAGDPDVVVGPQHL